MYVIAHLSDPHLDGSEEARSRLRRITTYLGPFRRPVDVVLVTGDLADHGLSEEYAELAAELDLPVPVLVLPGNHDVSTPFLARLTSFIDISGHPVHQVRDVGEARFVLLDTTVPGENHGLLSEESLAWLDGVLREPFDGPLFVAFHQPPFTCTTRRWTSGCSAPANRSPPSSRTNRSPRSSPATSTTPSQQPAGIPLCVAPGIRSSVPLPFEPESPTGTLVDLTTEPGFALHIHVPGEPFQTVYQTPR